MTEKNYKHMLPLYLLLDIISNNFSHALSCLRLSGHDFLVQRLRYNRKKGLLMSLGSVTNVTGTLFRMRNTFYCWTVHVNILLVSLRTQHRQLILPPHLFEG